MRSDHEQRKSSKAQKEAGDDEPGLISDKG